MYEADKRLFVGIKISPALQKELDHCARGSEHFFKEDKAESLRVVTLGEEKLIGRYLRDGFPVSDMDNVTRNIRSIIQLVTPGYRIVEDAIRIYANVILPGH